MTESSTGTKLLDFEPPVETFYDDVVAGLSSQPRSLPCKYFYDERGSKLFDQICELDEYYLTRTELSIMSRYAEEMAAQIGPSVMLVEYGSGSSIKTRILLDHLRSPVAYVPVDISRDHLRHSADNLAMMFPDIEVLSVCADFTEDFELPVSRRESTHNAVYFPGSTIGNFQPEAAQAILSRLVNLCGCGGGLLLGIDLQKDRKTLESAYNDDAGVTAAFNLNLLGRINRELDGDIRMDQFAHRAHYNEALNRVEIALVSQCDQTLNIGHRSFDLAAGESIHTEYSHKYTIDGFAELAAVAGLTLRKAWTDPQNRFAVLYFAILD
ncbi:MAG: L-histidine N(alpha)-methyltransferase [Pirellulales bacterium]|nr:L-histidine N(alpha)-methyltransferase [Pirellulales bacterium]